MTITRAAARAELSLALKMAEAWAREHGAKASPDDSWAVIRSDYRARIAEAMTDYLATDKPATSFRNTFRRAASDDLNAAFWNGYAETSGEIDYQDNDALDWINAKVEAEFAFIGELFVALKQLRDQFWHGEVDSDGLRDEVAARVDGYAATLENVHGMGRLYGDKNQMLTYDGDDGNESCRQCQKWKGKRQRAKTWIAKGLAERNGNPNFECGRWDNCQHHFFNDKGEMVIE